LARGIPGQVDPFRASFIFQFVIPSSSVATGGIGFSIDQKESRFLLSTLFFVRNDKSWVPTVTFFAFHPIYLQIFCKTRR
jgi:hypothetical protein